MLSKLLSSQGEKSKKTLWDLVAAESGRCTFQVLVYMSAMSLPPTTRVVFLSAERLPVQAGANVSNAFGQPGRGSRGGSCEVLLGEGRWLPRGVGSS